MQKLDETAISRAIIETYHARLCERLNSDVLVVGAGPAGMMAAFQLARQGYKVAIFEKRLAPGGGVWGGGMAMPMAVVQEEVLPLLREIDVRSAAREGGLYTVDAIELAAALCLKALQAGAALFNLTAVEDVCLHEGCVSGVVVNRTMVSPALPVDPITFSGRAVIDATGHEAVVVETLRKRGLLKADQTQEYFGEGPMDAGAGEAFVVDNVTEIAPGLWVTGMSVCAALGGPRMGPIFGGMLMSGQRVAEQIAATLGK